jgi:hypothetical protein
MSPHETLHPANWTRARGYANGIAAEGRMVFTGGLIGWTADTTAVDYFVIEYRSPIGGIQRLFVSATTRDALVYAREGEQITVHAEGVGGSSEPVGAKQGASPSKQRSARH